MTEEDIAQHFGSIGMLKEDKKRSKPKIWLYRDKVSGAPKVRCRLFGKAPWDSHAVLVTAVNILACRGMAQSPMWTPFLLHPQWSGSMGRNSKVLHSQCARC